MSGSTPTTIDVEDKKQLWDSDEVQALLSLWGDGGVQAELEASVRNERVYARISADLRAAGITRSPKQCREKVKKLKQEYKRLSEAPGGREGRRRSRHYQLLDAVLGRSRAAADGRLHAPVATASYHHHQQNHQQQHDQHQLQEEDHQQHDDEQTHNQHQQMIASPQDSEDASSLHSDASVLVDDGNDSSSAPQAGASSHVNSPVTSPRSLQGKKRKRDGPDSAAELARCMRDSDDKYMEFLRREMQAERELRERHVTMEHAQRRREAEAAAALNRELLSFFKQLGHALLARSAGDLPLD